MVEPIRIEVRGSGSAKELAKDIERIEKGLKEIGPASKGLQNIFVGDSNKIFLKTLTPIRQELKQIRLVMGQIGEFSFFRQSVESVDVLQRKLNQLASETVKFSKTIAVAGHSAGGFLTTADKLSIKLSTIEKSILALNKELIEGKKSSDLFEKEMANLQNELKGVQASLDKARTSLEGFEISERDIATAAQNARDKIAGLATQLGILRGARPGVIGADPKTLAGLEKQLALVQQIRATTESLPVKEKEIVEKQIVSILEQQLGLKKAQTLQEHEQNILLGVKKARLAEENTSIGINTANLQKETAILTKNLNLTELASAAKRKDVTYVGQARATQQAINDVLRQTTTLEQQLLKAKGIEAAEVERIRNILRQITGEYTKHSAEINKIVGQNKALTSSTQAQLRTTIAGFGQMIKSQAIWVAGFGVMFGVLRQIRESIKFVLDEQNAAIRAFRVLRLTPGGRGNTLLGIDVEQEKVLIKEVIQPLVSNKIRQAVVETGSTFKDLGEIFFQLGSAGLTAGEQFAAFRSTLRTIIATEGDVRETTKLVAGLYNTLFRNVQEGNSIFRTFERINNVITKVFQDHQVELDELRNGYKFLATSANIAGFTFEEISAILAVLNDNLIKSGIAGRSMQTVLSRISRDFQKVVREFGLSTKEFDATLPLAQQLIKILDQLHKRYGQQALDVNELAVIFRNMGLRGARSFAILIANAEEFKHIVDDLNDPQALAKISREMERIKLASPERTFARLSNTVNDLLGQGFKPFVDALVEGVRVFNELDPAVRRFISTLISFATAAGAALVAWKGLSLAIGLFAGGAALTTGGIAGLAIVSIVGLGAALHQSGVFSSELSSKIQNLKDSILELDKVPLEDRLKVVNDIGKGASEALDQVNKDLEQQKGILEKLKKESENNPYLSSGAEARLGGVKSLIKFLQEAKIQLQAIILTVTQSRPKIKEAIGGIQFELDKLLNTLTSPQSLEKIKNLFNFNPAGFKEFVSIIKDIQKTYDDAVISANEFGSEEFDLSEDLTNHEVILGKLDKRLKEVIQQNIKFAESISTDPVKRYSHELNVAQNAIDSIGERIVTITKFEEESKEKSDALLKEYGRLIKAILDRAAAQRNLNRATENQNTQEIVLTKNLDNVIRRLEESTRKRRENARAELEASRIRGQRLGVPGEKFLSQSQIESFNKARAKIEKDILNIKNDYQARLNEIDKIEKNQLATLDKQAVKNRGIVDVEKERARIIAVSAKSRESEQKNLNDRLQAENNIRNQNTGKEVRAVNIAKIRFETEKKRVDQLRVTDDISRQIIQTEIDMLELEGKYSVLLETHKGLSKEINELKQKELEYIIQYLEFLEKQRQIEYEFDERRLHAVNLQTASSRKLATLRINYEEKIAKLENKRDAGRANRAKIDAQILELRRQYFLAEEEAINRIGQINLEEAENARDAWQGAIQAIGDGYRTELARTKAIASEFTEIWRDTFDQLRDLGVDLFRDILDGGVDSWEDFSDRVVDIMKDMAARIAASLIFTPIINGIQGALGGGGGFASAGGGGFAALSGFGGSGAGGGFTLSDAGGVASFAGLFSGGGSSAAATYAMNFGENAALFFGANPGTAVSTGLFAGNAARNLTNPWTGIAGFAGGTAAQLVLSGSRTASQNTNAQIGSTVGGIIGGIWGPWTAALGAAAGNFLGGLFGSSKKNTGPKTDKATQASFYETAQAIFQATGVPLGFANNIRNLARNFGEAGQPSGSLQEVFNIGIRQFIRAYSEQFGELGDVLNRIDFANVNQALDDLNFALIHSRLEFGLIEEELTQGEQAIKNLNERMEELTAQARRLGLSEQVLLDARDEALQKLRTEFDEVIRLAILQLTDPIQFELEQLADLQEIRLRDAKALGLNLVQIEKLYALERQEIIKKSASGLNQFLEELFSGSNSPFAPQVILANASATFDKLRSQILSGDLSNVGELQNAANNLLDAARQMFASSTGFFDIFRTVTNTIALVTGQNVPAFATGGSMTVGGSGGTDSQFVGLRASPGEEVAVGYGLTDIMQRVGTEIARGNSIAESSMVKIEKRLASIEEGLNNQQAALERFVARKK